METFLVIIVFTALYLTPTIIAYSRNHTNATGVMLVNIFLGWSGLGWLAALIWSVQIAKSEKIREIKVEIKK